VTVTDAPKIITYRFDFDDSHTMARYEATGGYEALRRALELGPTGVHEEVRTASAVTATSC
jgi:NADH-quinone oxidoreductase subunit F